MKAYTLPISLIVAVLFLTGCSNSNVSTKKAKVAAPANETSSTDEKASTDKKVSKEDLKQKVIEKHGGKFNETPQLESNSSDFFD